MNKNNKYFKKFIEDKNNMFISYKNPTFVEKVNSIIKASEHIGYVAFINIPTSRKLNQLTKLNTNIPLVINKGKLVKTSKDHAVDGEIVMKSIGNIFKRPLAIIKDNSIRKNHESPTLNYVSKVLRNGKPFYVIVEINSYTRDGNMHRANIIKTMFDKSKIDSYIKRISEKEKAGLTLLYLE